MAQCLEIAPVLEELKFLWWEEPTRRVIADYVQLKKALHTVKVSGGEGRAKPRRVDGVGGPRRLRHQSSRAATTAGVPNAGTWRRMAHTRGKLLCTHNWQDGLVGHPPTLT